MDILSIKKHTVSSLLFDIIERMIFFMNVISWTRQFSWFDHYIDLLKHKDEEIKYKKYGMMDYRRNSSFTTHIMKTSTCAELMWDFLMPLKSGVDQWYVHFIKHYIIHRHYHLQNVGMY